MSGLSPGLWSGGLSIKSGLFLSSNRHLQPHVRLRLPQWPHGRWGAGLSHPSERWPRAGPGPPWETRVTDPAERGSQPTRRRWGHPPELLRNAAWNPGLTDAVRNPARDLVWARVWARYLRASGLPFLALAIGTSHPQPGSAMPEGRAVS